MNNRHLEMEQQSLAKNTVFPISGDEDKPNPASPNKEEAETLIRYPHIFQVSQEVLVNIVKDAEKRKFCEEVDKMESLGGDSFLEKALYTNFISGISTNPEEILQREEEYGHNRREPREPESFFALLWNALQDFTLRILLVCAAVAIILEVATADESERSIAWIDGFAIFVAVCVCSSVQAGNDYQKERQFQRLNKVADDKKMISVFRDGKLLDIHNSHVLVGDVVQINEGMDIPADGYVISAADLLCDESSMTGETEPMKKNTLANCIKKRNELIHEDLQEKAGYHAVPSPLLLSGSRVLQGEGLFIVIVVGPRSCLGRIQAKLEQETESTPLQQKLENLFYLARGIGKFGLYSALLILVVLLIRFAVTRIQQDNFYKEEHWTMLLSYLMISITVIAVAIPEGLPLSVVISLAYSVKKMLNDNNLVRRLHACETMGGANMICSDKTGTLTQNKMTLTHFWNEKRISIDAYNINSLSSFLPPNFHDLFLQATIVNSSAILRPTVKGSSTEVALLNLAEKCSINYEDVRNSYEIERKMPFTSSRKRMGTIILINGSKRLIEKGASELLLDCCTKMHTLTGEILPMNDQRRTNVMEAIEDMAKDALRTLAIAYKDLDGTENFEDQDQKGVYSFEKYSLTLFGVLGIKDILREEVPNAVLSCKRAGIKVRMVTGDNKITARAIAKECHIIDPKDENSLVLEGSEFMTRIGGIICENCLTAECSCAPDEKTASKNNKKVRKDTIKNGHEFDKIYKHIDVLARSRPEDKYAMVVGLKERGNVVAVTGDGTNDAPALKKADVGFAMGQSGTEVAREAADIILLDDNFSSLVKAVLWGRNIYDCIKKFLQFQLTVNIVAVGITLIGAAVIQQEVLQPIQMLWINLIMDTLASLALATEPPNITLLDRKPTDRNEYMITKKMFKHIIGQAVYQLAILIILIFDGENFIPEFPDNLDAEIIKKNLPLSVKYNGEFVRSGRYYDIVHSDVKDYYDLEKDYGPSRHFTFIFNTFVWMQIFNFLNARKINDEFNIMGGITKNLLFLFIVFLIMFLQCIIVTHGSVAFHVYNWYDDETGGAGLHFDQWLMCIAFGAGGIIVSFFLKLLPEHKCLQAGVKKKDPIHDPSKILEIRRGDSTKKFSNLIHQNPSFKRPSFQKTSFVHKGQGVHSNNNITQS